ncbi:hypothetical protein GCK32_010332 [Trichostrongylus colubriformis]|uniref:Uncharacterized protein n=1 Tax=Trichostrongylus colubriformis TaxID=6319 RepID=A0AAN8FBV0_TRICO
MRYRRSEKGRALQHGDSMTIFAKSLKLYSCDLQKVFCTLRNLERSYCFTMTPLFAFIVNAMLYSCNFSVFSSYFRRNHGGFMLPKDTGHPHIPGSSLRSELLFKIRKIPLPHIHLKQDQPYHKR